MRQRIYIFSIFFSIFFLISLFLLSFFVLRAPVEFPTGSIYIIKSGISLNLLATSLNEQKVIRSPFWFKTFSVLFGGTKGVIAGDYVLDKRQNTVSLAKRITTGDFDLIPIKVMIQEGLNISEIAVIISTKFPKINETDFLNKTKDLEGYLFPDTYFFLPNSSAKEIITKMNDTFNEEISTVSVEINSFKKPFSDIIKMASIIEKEARTTESRRIVAGILWKRESIGMLLQVDSSFKYINGKTTATLTLDDLKIDSAYNSYLYKGLPPTPICNPGLNSILATVIPIETNYLYFLSDKTGEMHYAETYKVHLQNKELYLK